MGHRPRWTRAVPRAHPVDPAKTEENNSIASVRRPKQSNPKTDVFLHWELPINDIICWMRTASTQRSCFGRHRKCSRVNVCSGPIEAARGRSYISWKRRCSCCAKFAGLQFPEMAINHEGVRGAVGEARIIVTMSSVFYIYLLQS